MLTYFGCPDGFGLSVINQRLVRQYCLQVDSDTLNWPDYNYLDKKQNTLQLRFSEKKSALLFFMIIDEGAIIHLC